MTELYSRVTDVMPSYSANVRAKAPKTYNVGPGFEPLRIGKSLINVIGAQPGAGKTALLLQIAIDAMFIDPTLRVLIVNVEMPIKAILDRQLARLSNVPLDMIQGATVTQKMFENIEIGLKSIEVFQDRLAIIHEPFSMDRIEKAAEEHAADLIILDYLHEIKSAERSEDQERDAREDLKKCLRIARKLASEDKALLVVAAVNRGVNGDYTDLDIYSFRDSSAIEYNADTAYILDKSGEYRMLRGVKFRNREHPPIRMKFIGEYQRFVPMNGGGHV